jgi:hypothetical protein
MSFCQGPLAWALSPIGVLVVPNFELDAWNCSVVCMVVSVVVLVCQVFVSGSFVTFFVSRSALIK